MLSNLRSIYSLEVLVMVLDHLCSSFFYLLLLLEQTIFAVVCVHSAAAAAGAKGPTFWICAEQE